MLLHLSFASALAGITHMLGGNHRMTPDYLTDERLVKIGFMPLKKALKEANVPADDLSSASTKFALITVAEKHKVALDSIFNNLAQVEPAKPATAKKAPKSASPSKSDASTVGLAKVRAKAETKTASPKGPAEAEAVAEVEAKAAAEKEAARLRAVEETTAAAEKEAARLKAEAEEKTAAATEAARLMAEAEAASEAEAARLQAEAEAKSAAEVAAEAEAEAQAAAVAKETAAAANDAAAAANDFLTALDGAKPTGRWDDGARCVDKPGGCVLWCSRCGNRPRPAHDFRCRLHDEELSNADERPGYPQNVEDKMAIRRYAKDLDEWQPAWLESDEDELPPIDAANAYPLHCPRCERKTELCGVPGAQFSTNLQRIQMVTDWLPSAYDCSVNAPTATPDRSFNTHAGLWGRCVPCKLLVSIQDPTAE